ncbi:MAG: POTRA domain-containing protein [Candidatus Omnitrophota bacterium]
MIKNIQLKAIIFFSFIILTYPAKSFSQTPPPSVDAGAQAERYRFDTQQEKKRIEYKKPKAPEIEVEEEKKEVKPAIGGVSFVLKGVNLSGVTIFKPEDLQPLYQPYLEQKVTFADLETIMQKIKDKYKQEGYITTLVYFPEQEITEGVIEIQVAEGKMGDLKVEGNKWFPTPLIEKYFHLKKNEILNIKDIQRDILRLNKISDLDVKTVISAGKEPLQSDITLKVTDNFPHHAGISYDSFGTRLTGKSRSSVFLRSSNLSGRADTIFINSLLTSGSFGESVSYSCPLDTYGTKFGLDMTYFKMRLGKEYKPYNISGRSQIYTPYVKWELALSEASEINAGIGMDIKCIKKKTYATLTSNDQIRMPYFEFNFSKTDYTSGQTFFTPRFSFAPKNFWGASSRNHPSASRAGTGGFFFKYEQSLSRIQKMPFGSYSTWRSNFQAASHTLPSSEQIQIGGANSLRGYPEGDYLADMGGYLDFDWVFPNYLIPESWKLSNSQTTLRYQIQPVLFVDIGGGKLKKVNTGERYKKFLVGVGGGLRINLGKHFYTRVEWAEHLGDRPTGGVGPSTFYITFQSEI